ncbi:MAG: PBP1 and LysM peptidoglycan-binding domain-containing protein [Flavobacteriaceae bacterium]
MRYWIVFLALFIGFQTPLRAQTPERFISHKVRKSETLYSLARQYEVSVDQILTYNAIVKKTGLKRRMILRIPVYTQEPKSAPTPIYDFVLYTVQPKETKWRIAYKNGLTVADLEALNPQILNGLQIGQQIRLPQPSDAAKRDSISPTIDESFNYYTVQPKEGFYRIQQKIGVDRATLETLNPQLAETGLQVGMILKVPGDATGELKVENALLVETNRIADSLKLPAQVSLALLLPFKGQEILFDSVARTQYQLSRRNLHTISLDFYFGALLAIDEASRLGVQILLEVFDTQNDKYQIKQLVEQGKLNGFDALIGPLIPSNFDFLSGSKLLAKTPKISPLSTKRVRFRSNVIQSMPSEKRLRDRMFSYLEKYPDTLSQVFVVVDSIHKDLEPRWKNLYPQAQLLLPEVGNVLLPDLVDSLLVDSIPNKVILESKDLALIASTTSLLNAQLSKGKAIELYTSYRSNIYDNAQIPKEQLGALKFTYPDVRKPLGELKDTLFLERYHQKFGNFPEANAIRAYDIVLDFILRLAVGRELSSGMQLGRTEYRENAFDYRLVDEGAYENTAVFVLQHQGFEIVELKK